MPMDAEEIQALILRAIPDARVVVEDLVGDRDHYKVTVRSGLFRHKSLVQQHQMVYKSLGSCVGRELHALTLDTAPADEVSSAADVNMENPR
jgi:stress-induced morphogen